MYVSLHNRSAYSFGSSVVQPELLAEFAARHNMLAIALTDRDGLYAAVAFQQACAAAGVKPIYGVETDLASGPSVTLLAQTPAGYANLCRLVSLRHLREALLTIHDVASHAAGLVCLLGRWPAMRSAVTPTAAGTTNWTDLLRQAFDHHLYVELFIHGPDDAPVARRRAQWADEQALPVVASCESRCRHRDESATLQALSAIGTLTLLDQPHPDKPIGDWHLRTPAEMARPFARRPDALTNTVVVAEQCAVELDFSQNRFPPFESADGKAAIDCLRALAIAGCRRRYVEEPQQRGIGGKRPTLVEALERLERELAIIDQVHYAEYFLVFHEIVEECRRRGIASLARGSAADSLVCYVLGVSHACPFRFDLPFDRFVNPERARFSKMADIDLDLPWDRRDEIIRWVYERWGQDRVAMIGCPHTFHARAAVAELGKVFGLPAHEVHRVTKLLPHVTSWDIAEAASRSPECRELPLGEEPYRTVVSMARHLEGLPRHWSMHPCGLVVSPTPLTDLVPVQPSPKGPLVAQYDMEAIETLGFIKIDLLGQAGLSVLRDTVNEIQRSTGVAVALDHDVDYSDAATWHLIATGHARGVHHIESPAMTSLLQQCNCRDIDCLTAVVAIIRPGAANQGKKEAFARRCQGLEPPHFVHPGLHEVLKQTYGLMVFEEHILQVAVEFAGMNLGRADVLRRALNKENHIVIEEMRGEFRAAALAKGRPPVEIDAVWSQVAGFCGFMFNKAHSAEYAVEAFQGAWLKRRWPAHYLAAILSNYRGFYAHSPTLPQIMYVMEARRLGIGFLPPCVNRSREKFSVEYGTDEAPSRSPLIRLPVSHIHGLSTSFLERYQAARALAPFDSLSVFFDRCRPSEGEGHALLDSGALDCFGENRPMLFWQLRRLLRQTRTGHEGLWSGRGEEKVELPPLALTVPDVRALAQREMELLGFPVTLAPLTFLGSDEEGRTIDWSRYTPVAELGKHHHRRVTVCGLMVADRINAARNGGLMKFVSLADESGCVEAVVFPDTYRQFGHLTVAHPILAASGIVEPFVNLAGHTFRVSVLSPPVRAKLEVRELQPG